MKKKNRVRKSEEFQDLIHKGKKILNRSFVFYYLPKAEKENRIGITLSKKMGNAVVRNKIKRQVRMMCQDVFDFDSYPYDVILIIRYGYVDQTFESNKKALEKLAVKATI